MSQNWFEMTAGDLGRGIGDGSIDPVELAEGFLDAIDGHVYGDRIYARTTRTRAIAEAMAARDRAGAGQRLSLLDGVPISWKDLFDTAGVATEAGTALLEGRVPDKDAEVLANATRQGLVCIGKTHMSELAFSGLGLNPVTETPPCINDFDAVPGGSSSGAGTSVAFGLAPAAIGSDTGGSVRIPSAWNDLVGLKTTSGALSLNGVVPLCMKFDTVGPLTRSVEDAALLWSALGGGDVTDLNGASLAGRRFLVLDGIAMDGVREKPAAAFEASIASLSAAGAIIETRDLAEISQALDLTGPLYATEAYGRWKDVIEANPEKMFPAILERFRAGDTYSAPQYTRAWEDLNAIRARYIAATAGFDAVLVPTSPILPPNADRLLTDNDYYVTENLLSLRNTRIGNLLGLAVLTLPTGVASCGISFMGAPGSEARLLRIGAAAEAALS